MHTGQVQTGTTPYDAPDVPDGEAVHAVTRQGVLLAWSLVRKGRQPSRPPDTQYTPRIAPGNEDAAASARSHFPVRFG